MSIKDNIEYAERYLAKAKEDIEKNPDIDTLSELLDALFVIENYYRDRFCPECDEDFGEDNGTTYEEGISLEFYIEAVWWHDVSKAIRKLSLYPELDEKQD